MSLREKQQTFKGRNGRLELVGLVRGESGSDDTEVVQAAEETTEALGSTPSAVPAPLPATDVLATLPLPLPQPVTKVTPKPKPQPAPVQPAAEDSAPKPFRSRRG
jgi:hypothetical protein